MAREWVKTHGGALDTQETAFLDASLRKRRQGKIALAASIVLAVVLSFGAWEWTRWQNAADFSRLSRVVDSSMKDAAQLAADSRWDAAIKELEGADRQLKPGAEYDRLRLQVENALGAYRLKDHEQRDQVRDRKFITALDEARLLGGGVRDKSFESQTIVTEYRRTFRGFGMDVDLHGPSVVTKLILAKPPEVRQELASSIDDWAGRVNAPEGARLRGVGARSTPILGGMGSAKR